MHAVMILNAVFTIKIFLWDNSRRIVWNTHESSYFMSSGYQLLAYFCNLKMFRPIMLTNNKDF